MYSFKKLFATICLVAVAACLVATGVSCNRISKCGAGVCANGGVCDNGNCVCATGYQGSTCQTVSRNAFMGNWTAFERNGIALTEPYPVSISAGKTAINDVTISNLFNEFTDPVNAYVVSDSVFIPYQKLAGYSIRGSGCLQANHILVINFVETTLLSNLIVAGAITLH